MRSSEKRPTAAQVNAVDLVLYLAGLGHQPSKIKGNDYWYLSPLRNERTASFKVNRRINRWYDFGSGQGGGLVDFGILNFNCSVRDFLDRFEHGLPVVPIVQPLGAKAQAKIHITQTRTLRAPSLLAYLSARGIPRQLACMYCCQVHYTFSDKRYFGIGFKNDSGGYEIRNPFYKSSSSPKAVTTLKNGGLELAVFEGFIDFLSYLVLYDSPGSRPVDYLILNSLSFFEKQRPFMESYHRVFCYLDNDIPGQKCVQLACSKSPVYAGHGERYAGYKDLNDKLTGKRLPAAAQPPTDSRSA